MNQQNNPNNRKKGNMNILIMIIVILIVDGLFLGYRALTKKSGSGAANNPVTLNVQVSHPVISQSIHWSL
ncbi:MAG TPA: hypothetical protein K8U88_04335 [Levilactobacillus hammesii]|uniref:Uncharacterized protein n=1 Tax=Levilactobacillus hammesii TaxID=267633 RepID=A0A921EZ43_9LACO|nr:hypothetical protein [Levilactobacillus hammesii]